MHFPELWARASRIILRPLKLAVLSFEVRSRVVQRQARAHSRTSMIAKPALEVSRSKTTSTSPEIHQTCFGLCLFTHSQSSATRFAWTYARHGSTCGQLRQVAASTPTAQRCSITRAFIPNESRPQSGSRDGRVPTTGIDDMCWFTRATGRTAGRCGCCSTKCGLRYLPTSSLTNWCGLWDGARMRGRTLGRTRYDTSCHHRCSSGSHSCGAASFVWDRRTLAGWRIRDEGMDDSVGGLETTIRVPP